ncbi:MAG: PKD domain-containing protein [Allomuricauda sp.]
MRTSLKIISLLFILFCASCSKESSNKEPEGIACFEIGSANVEVGELVEVSNCSIDAISYEFDFGNGKTSTEANPSISYEFPGEYTIKLKITSPDGKIKSTSIIVNVNPIDNNYIHPPLINGDFIYPTDFGMVDGKFYYIERYSNIFTSLDRTFNYIEIDNSFKITKTVLHDRNYNSSHTSLRLLDNGKKIVHTVESMSDRIGSSEIWLNADWTKETAVYNSSKPIYGSIQVGSDLVFFGSKSITDEQNENFKYFKRPYIEIRDNLGQEKNFKVFNQIEQGFIGDLIQAGNNYIAFGGTSTPTGINTFNNYKPLIILLDSNFDFISFKTFETEIYVPDYNSLNDSFHIKKLSNGNFVIYSHDEFRIINSEGEELKKVSLSNIYDSQGLICLEEGGFILSTGDYLKKYDSNGNLIKSLRFNGKSTPQLIRKGNQIYFASGYLTTYPTDTGNVSTYKIFIGSTDLDLNIINLN